MLHSEKLVKFLPIFFLVLTSCAHEQKKILEAKPLATTHQKEWMPQVFAPHENWLGLNVDFKPITEIRTQIEHLGGVPLISRGEAHITVVSPIEFESLKDKISMNEIELIAEQLDIQKSKWKPICVGSFAEQKGNAKIQNITYFVVIESSSLLELRREIYRRYLTAGGKASAFTPHRFFPHITIGYIEKDLHESDGAIKDSRTCLFDLATPLGEKLTNWNQ